MDCTIRLHCPAGDLTPSMTASTKHKLVDMLFSLIIISIYKYDEMWFYNIEARIPVSFDYKRPSISPWLSITIAIHVITHHALLMQWPLISFSGRLIHSVINAKQAWVDTSTDMDMCRFRSQMQIPETIKHLSVYMFIALTMFAVVHTYNNQCLKVRSKQAEIDSWFHPYLAIDNSAWSYTGAEMKSLLGLLVASECLLRRPRYQREVSHGPDIEWQRVYLRVRVTWRTGRNLITHQGR